MRQTSIKSDEVARLIEEIAHRTGESKVDVVRRSLEDRLNGLRSSRGADRTLAWLESSVWAAAPAGERGRMPSKKEQEELLGF